MSHTQTGSLLVEVILVTFLFGIIATALISSVLTSLVSAKQGVEYVVATGYIQEGIEAVRSLRDQDWSLVTNGTHGLATESGTYAFDGFSDTLDGTTYTRTITVEDVFRLGSIRGDIAPSGVLDTNTKKVTVNLMWDVLHGRTQNIDAVFYVYNWAVQAWIQTLTADFELGNINSTSVASTLDGEVELMQTDADWLNLNSIASLDMTGSTSVVAVSIDVTSDILYTLSTSISGNDFQAIDISDMSSDELTVLGGFDANMCYDFAIKGGYAYLACDQSGPGAEVIILSLPSMTQIGSINLPEALSATSIDIETTTLVIGRNQGPLSQEVYFYNVSSPSTPVLLGSTETGVDVADVETNGTFAFVGTGSNSSEMMVISETSFSIVDTLDLSGSDDVNSVCVVGEDVYVGRDNGTQYDIARLDGSDPVGTGLTVS